MTATCTLTPALHPHHTLHISCILCPSLPCQTTLPSHLLYSYPCQATRILNSSQPTLTISPQLSPPRQATNSPALPRYPYPCPALPSQSQT
ncbi:hypothetical protein E2C01_055709 [Portunus trituberculatus]|uniref:Uncharacterized protein n=1 Tax=Portunus trituberculatus TaxID=210409 RepID=A0A5B7GVI0_PORTR|nr:hypothetical protein [Portunus trituberculatus]